MVTRSRILSIVVLIAVLFAGSLAVVQAQDPQTAEPDISCPAGFDLVTTWQEDLRADGLPISSQVENFTLAQSAQVVLPTWSAVGHPELGCQPGIQNPSETTTIDDDCDDISQDEEAFTIGFPGSPVLATVPDHGTDQWLFYGNVNLGTLPAGNHSVAFRHILADNTQPGEPESVIYKTGLCVASAPPPPPPPTITVVKVVINNDGGTAVVSDFPLFLAPSGGAAQSVTSGVAVTVSAGTYVASETTIGGYTASFSGDCDANGVITIANGQNLTCTITNDDPPLQPPPTVPPPTNPPPQPTNPPPPPPAQPTPQIVVQNMGEPAIAKSANPPFALPGNDVTWTITVTNPTSGTFTNVRVNDTIPGEAIIQSVSSSSGNVSFSGQTVSFTQGSLEPGGSVTINVATRISDAARPPFSITNGAELRVNESPNVYRAQATVLSIAALPAAGLSPLQAWRLPVFAGVSLLALGLTAFSVRRLRRREKR